jgi:hypothetical protein
MAQGITGMYQKQGTSGSKPIPSRPTNIGSLMSKGERIERRDTDRRVIVGKFTAILLPNPFNARYCLSECGYSLKPKKHG